MSVVCLSGETVGDSPEGIRIARQDGVYGYSYDKVPYSSEGGRRFAGRSRACPVIPGWPLTGFARRFSEYFPQFTFQAFGVSEWQSSESFRSSDFDALDPVAARTEYFA